MNTWFVCSDIHSFYDEWMLALDSKKFDINNPEHKIIVCGDLFDRGKQTVQCYEFAKKMLEEKRMVYVLGNHEQLMLNLLHQVSFGVDIGGHHISNGTLSSLAHFMGKSEYDIICGVFTTKEFDKAFSTISDLINYSCVNYFELGDFIFVHSWIPTTEDDVGNFIIDPNWRPKKADWNRALWGNPFDEWAYGVGSPEGKTVVVGHWHTSYAHSHFNNDGTEWGVDANFDIFKRNGIIGLDACTAFTHMVNCLVIEEDENGTYHIKQEDSN